MRYEKEEIKLKNVNNLPDQNCEVELLIPENLQEAIQDAGGETQLVDAYIDHKRNRALTSARNAYRTAAEGSVVEDLIEKVKGIVKNFSLAANERGMGVQKKAKKVDTLIEQLQSGREFSREELLAMLTSGR